MSEPILTPATPTTPPKRRGRPPKAHKAEKVAKPIGRPKKAADPMWRTVLRLPKDKAEELRAVAKKESWSINGTVALVIDVFLESRRQEALEASALKNEDVPTAPIGKIEEPSIVEDDTVPEIELTDVTPTLKPKKIKFGKNKSSSKAS